MLASVKSLTLILFIVVLALVVDLGMHLALLMVEDRHLVANLDIQLELRHLKVRDKHRHYKQVIIKDNLMAHFQQLSLSPDTNRHYFHYLALFHMKTVNALVIQGPRILHLINLCHVILQRGAVSFRLLLVPHAHFGAIPC